MKILGIMIQQTVDLVNIIQLKSPYPKIIKIFGKIAFLTLGPTRRAKPDGPWKVLEKMPIFTVSKMMEMAIGTGLDPLKVERLALVNFEE